MRAIIVHGSGATVAVVLELNGAASRHENAAVAEGVDTFIFTRAPAPMQHGRGGHSKDVSHDPRHYHRPCLSPNPNP